MSAPNRFLPVGDEFPEPHMEHEHSTPETPTAWSLIWICGGGALGLTSLGMAIGFWLAGRT